jgi:hypothetical protein
MDSRRKRFLLKAFSFLPIELVFPCASLPFQQAMMPPLIDVGCYVLLFDMKVNVRWAGFGGWLRGFEERVKSLVCVLCS